jgi:hypothetical protein
MQDTDHVGEGWQLIETAPKDGTQVVAGAWDDGVWRQAVVAWAAGWSRVWSNEQEEWWRLLEDGAHSINDALLFEPSHWMPLPDPPKEPKNEE